ncbi:MAG TPA: hypothetical protein VK915_00135 [Gaiellaceae bacterium]|nr:hypothetical protein [Gaiellaceae bacterium]
METAPRRDALRRTFLIGPPLVLAAVLWFHPAGGENVYEGLRHDATAWFRVHVALLLVLPLLGIAAYLLLDGLHGRAATLSRLALAPFLVFYTAYEATVGVATGVLVDHANGLPAAEQAVVAGAIQDLNRNPILADPSVSLVLGVLGWVVAMVAAAVALRRSGAGWAPTVLVGLAAVFAVHPPPVGPFGLVCFAAAAVLVERSRARLGRASDPRRDAGALAAHARSGIEGA